VQTNASGNLLAAVMPAHTGDVTSPAGSIVNTLATVNANVGTFQGLTLNAKGLVTAAANMAYAPLASPSFTGDVTVAGGVKVGGNATIVLSLSGAYTQIISPDQAAAILLGGAGDPTLYCRNASHQFAAAAGSPIYAVMGATGTAYGLRPALWVGAVGALTTVLWTWFSPLRDADVVAD
jgi:hypothetical protein